MLLDDDSGVRSQDSMYCVAGVRPPPTARFLWRSRRLLAMLSSPFPSSLDVFRRFRQLCWSWQVAMNLVYGRQFAWAWMKEHWAELFEKFGTGGSFTLPRLVSYSTKTLATAGRIDREEDVWSLTLPDRPLKGALVVNLF